MHLDLLHQREPETLRDAAFDLPLDGARIDRFADLLRRADPDDARESEVDVDFGDDLHRTDAEGNVCALTGDLARVGIKRRRRRMAINAFDISNT